MDVASMDAAEAPTEDSSKEEAADGTAGAGRFFEMERTVDME